LVSNRLIENKLRQTERLHMTESEKQTILNDILSADSLTLNQDGHRIRYRLRLLKAIVAVATFMIVGGGAFGVYHHFQNKGYSTATSQQKNTNAVSRPIAQELAGLGITAVPTKPQMTTISKKTAIASANSFLKHFEGTSRLVQLVTVSKRDGNSFVAVSPSTAKGDPHFVQQHNVWRDIPCYLIVISGVKNGMSPQGPAPNPPIPAKSLGRERTQWSPEVSNLQPSGYVRDYALVDATNGTLLTTFQVRSYSPNP
jgi:hypothetical protein